MRVAIGIMVALLALSPIISSAQAPRTMSYQGLLSDAAGIVITGSRSITFKLYDMASGGTALWTETQSSVSVDRGVFSVILGKTAPLNLAFDNSYWVGIAVDGGAELLPRTELTAAPYALRASTLDEAYDGGGAGLGATIKADALPVKIHGQQLAQSIPLILSRNQTVVNPQEMRYTIEDQNFVLHYVNDESESRLRFRLQNTDLETGGGAAASDNVVLSLRSNSQGAKVGIGNSTPERMLQVGTNEVQGVSIESPSILSESGYIRFGDNSGWRLFFARARESVGGASNTGTTGAIMTIQDNFGGRVGIGTTTPQQRLDVNGTTRTKILEITGGSDLAERFELVDPPDGDLRGMVVSIDPEHPGKVMLSREPYDRKVAGIISGAGGLRPGMIMSQDESMAGGRWAVAITGRVYCRVDATMAGVEPGDMLTTSSTLGLAMRATERERAYGAILGKAMSRLPRGETGEVLVLVDQQ